MSEQKWTPEPWYDNDGYRIYGPSPSGCKGVGSDRPLLGDFKPFDGTPFDSTRAVQCVNACAGIPDPAAEIARLRDAAEDVPILEAQVKGLLAGIANRDAELLRVRTTGHGAAHELDNIAIECGLGHSPKPGSVAEYVRKLRAEIDELRAQHAQDQADREHYMGKLGEALAENARLRAELAALTPPQPVAGWRERCVVEQAEDGMWDVHSPDRRWWWDGSEWVLYIADPDEWEHSTGRFGDEATVRAALAACPTPPPGVQA